MQEDGCDKGAHQSYHGAERNTLCQSKLVSALAETSSRLPEGQKRLVCVPEHRGAVNTVRFAEASRRLGKAEK